MSVIKYRIDSRMLHGQTAAAWGKVLHVDEYIVVNEKVANDSMQVTLLSLASAGNKLQVLSPAKAFEVISNEKFKGKKTLVVFKTIDDVVETVKCGLKIDQVSIGGMFEEKGRDRKQYEKCLFCDDHDIECFRYLESEGIDIVHQVVPEYKESKVKDLVKY